VITHGNGPQVGLLALEAGAYKAAAPYPLELAEGLCANLLLTLTDVTHVERDWGTRMATPIGQATPDEVRKLTFASGSMAPKVEAARRFVERTGGRAAIGLLADLAEVAAGTAGTQVTPAGVAVI
jgi:carbamate kinase